MTLYNNFSLIFTLFIGFISCTLIVVLFTMNVFKIRTKCSIYWKNFWHSERLKVYILNPLTAETIDDKTKTKNDNKKRLIHKAIVKNYLRISKSAQNFEQDGKTYIIDLDCGIIDQLNKITLYYEYGVSYPLPIEDCGNGFPADMFKKQLTASKYGKLYESSQEKVYMTLVIILIVALAGVSVFAFYQFGTLTQKIGDMNQQIIDLLKNQQTIPIIIT